MRSDVAHPSQVAPGQGRGETECIDLDRVSQVFCRTSGAREGESQHALHDVSLKVSRGQFVALVGASGCGKTTILNILAGLVAPTSGVATLDGKKPSIPNPSLSYMFARDALMPWRTARKNIELPLEAAGWSRTARRVRSMEMIELVGLMGKERRFPLELSQGMRQRVALARTWAPDPDLLLMDEPFAALDARTKLTMEAEFLRIWEGGAERSANRKTVVFVTHDLNEAVLLADRVVVMLPSPGRVAFDRPVELPRPRAQHLGEIMFSDEFKAIAQELFESLEGAFAPGSRSVEGGADRW